MELKRITLPPITAPGDVTTFYAFESGTARSIALVKARVRELDFAACQRLAQQALMLPGAHEVRAFVGEHC